MVGKILEHYELLSLEKLPYWELLLRVKEQARNKKLEKDVAQGCTGVNAKSQRVKDQEASHPTSTKSQVSDAQRRIAWTSTRPRGRAPARARAKERGRIRK